VGLAIKSFRQGLRDLKVIALLGLLRETSMVSFRAIEG
jgi:hypothetical protein